MSIFDQLLDVAASPRLIWIVLQAGLGVLTLALVTMLLTRWGTSRRLRKCTILSLWAHVLLIVYLATVDIIPSSKVAGPNYVRVTAIRESPIAEPRRDEDSAPRPDDKPWERVALGQSPMADAPAKTKEETPRPEPKITPGPAPTLPRLEAPLEPQPTPSALPKTSVLPKESLRPEEALPPEPLEAPQAQRREAPSTAGPVVPRPSPPAAESPVSPLLPPPAANLPSTLITAPSRLPRVSETPLAKPPAQPLAMIRTATARETAHEPAPRDVIDVGAAANSETSQPTDPAPQVVGEKTPVVPQARGSQGNPHGYQPPAVYRLRFSPDRMAEVERRGGSAQTEAAVAAALAWLAANQNTDGRWDPARFGAGREDRVLGHDRQGAGRRADSGITGLAVLAFLGAGHTHEESPYADTVARALAFLVRCQQTDGFLGEEAEACAQMYCHGMASLALSEAYALTGDEELQLPVRRAVSYTLAAQNPVTGGWRYRPRDVGDTSQLGWQLMALRSAELAGIEVPTSARQGMQRFLASVSNGSRGGLACYRPGEQNSRPMTAEALVCRQLLGLPREHATNAEAATYLLADELPNQGTPNFYYWYYATLGLFQQQGDAWQRWNQSLAPRLVSMQVANGPLAGSWDPNDVWGGYGGRVYSTALAAMCLEVYYRYLPLYAETAGEMRPVK